MPCYDSLMVLVTVWQQSEEEGEEGGREKVRERKGETEVNKRTDACVQRCRNVSALKMDGRQGRRISAVDASPESFALNDLEMFS